QPGFAPGSTYTQAGYSQPGGGYLFPIDPSTSEPINQLGGVLSATVTGSSFGSATIEQDGYCVANVALTSDAIAGNVIVVEGTFSGSGYLSNPYPYPPYVPGDTITANFDTFGPTW